MRYLYTIVFLIGFVVCSFGQQQDTTKITPVSAKPVLQDTTGLAQDSVKSAQDTTKKETRKERRERKKAEAERDKYYYKGIKKDSARLEIERMSRIAWKRSLAVPGWGQYTNKGLWWVKVPIIYGGLVTGYLVFDYWQWYYKKFLDELAYRIKNNNQGWQDPDLRNYNGTEGLVRQKDYGRRNRDLTILVSVGWWGLNVVEAYVDSMLKNRWNIGRDMTMKVGPTLLPSYSYTGGSALQGVGFTPGIKLTMNLK